MADKSYWLGELVGSRRVGGIQVDGKLYAIGEPFPADKVDQKKLAGFKKSGCVGSVPFPVSDIEPQGECAECKELGDRIVELETTAKADGDSIAGLQLELEAAGDAVALKIQVAELEPECKRLGDDNEEKAALIKELKAKVKALKKELKK